jgi:hypothetical protein
VRALDLVGLALRLAASLMAVLAIPVAALGLVVHSVLGAQGQRRVVAYVAAGAVAGCVCALSLALAAPSLALASQVAPQLVVVADPGGAVAALTFWMIRRPDRVTAGIVPTPREQALGRTP